MVDTWFGHIEQLHKIGLGSCNRDSVALGQCLELLDSKSVEFLL